MGLCFGVTLQIVKGSFNYTVRVRTGTRSRRSHIPIFKALGILTVPSQYTLSLMMFLINNLKYVTFNFSLHSINTQKKLQLHRLIANLTSLHRGEYFINTKILNKLPEYITDLIKIKSTLYWHWKGF